MSPRLNKTHHGVIVPMVTPLTPDHALDEAATCRVVDYMIERGVHGVFALGTTGENASLPQALRERLVDVTVRHVAGRVPTYAGISSNCLHDALASATSFARLGVDALVAHLPSYYELSPSEQHAYFTALADRVPAPLILYNINVTTHMSIPLDVVEALSRHPTVVAIKDSDRDLPRIEALIRMLGSRTDFSVLVGASVLAAQGLAAGADGCVPSQGNLIPGVCRAVYDAACVGDAAALAAWQARMDAVTTLYARGRTMGQGVARLKAMMGVQGLCGPTVMPPLLTVSAEEQADVEEAFRAWEREAAA